MEFVKLKDLIENIFISAVNCTDLPVPAPGTTLKPNDRGTYDWTIENGTNYGTLIKYR